MVPESRDPNPGRIDVVGVVLTILGLIAFVYGVIYGGQHTFGRPLAWGGMLVGAAILAGFVWYELHTDHPSLDVRLFRNPLFSASVGAVGLVFFAALGTFFFLSFYLQLVRNYSPLQSGLLLTPFAAAQLIFAPLSSTMVRLFGPKLVGTVGLLLVAVGLVGFATLSATAPIALLGLYFFIQGAGMANVLPPATESIMASVPRDRAGVGSAIQNTVRQVGGALGVAVLGSLIASIYRGHIGPALGGLPAGVQQGATSSIATAFAVAGEAGPQAGRVTTAAKDAFVTAMHWAASASAVIAVLGALVAFIWIPGRSLTMPPPPRPPEPQPAPEPAPVPAPGSEPRGRTRWPVNTERLVSGPFRATELTAGRKVTLAKPR
jgi:Na+/melibiose symporter-like transporter